MSKSIRSISLEDIDKYQKDGLISFEGKPHNFCICLVDIVKSTNKISKIYKDSIKLRNYYSLFLNTMGKIIINHHGNILKNNGDSIIFYFPKTTDISPANKSSFIDAIECGLTMASARCIINRKAHEEKIPPIYYRISTVYGKVETSKSLFINSNDSNVKTIDLFGHVMNLCAKINNIAPDNCIVIGEDFYNIILSITSKDELSSEYLFQEIGKYQIEPNQEDYKIYCVLSRYNRVITKNKDSNTIKSLKEGDKKDSSDISKQYRILLVDDDVDILFTYKLALDSENYNVDAFSDPRIALKSFAEYPVSYYDLVILDIRMPSLNGIQLFYRLKSIDMDVKILFASALDAAEELTSILPGIKFDDLIRKPINIDHLIYKVKSTLDK